ncbi:hypothetical protein ACWDF9_35110 [Streptomyces rubiginosohelvolus]
MTTAATRPLTVIVRITTTDSAPTTPPAPRAAKGHSGGPAKPP